MDIVRCRPRGCRGREIRSGVRLRGWEKLRGNPKRPGRSYTVEKSLVVEPGERPYRKPTLVGTPEREKVIEITLVKELGNLTP